MFLTPKVREAVLGSPCEGRFIRLEEAFSACTLLRFEKAASKTAPAEHISFPCGAASAETLKSYNAERLEVC